MPLHSMKFMEKAPIIADALNGEPLPPTKNEGSPSSALKNEAQFLENK